MTSCIKHFEKCVCHSNIPVVEQFANVYLLFTQHTSQVISSDMWSKALVPRVYFEQSELDALHP